MLTTRIQAIDGVGTYTPQDSQPCRLLQIPVGILLARYPPDGPGRALISASGSYLG